MSDSAESSAAKKHKGILKSSSFDKQGCSNRKSAKFDELNVLQTYHPPDKDYGHMKVEEPKTPYNYMDPSLAEADELDAKLLTEKLKEATEVARRASLVAESSSGEEEEEIEETEEERARRIEFEKRRKAHYVNEFEASKLARKLIQEELNLDSTDRIEEEKELDEEDEDGDIDLEKNASKPVSTDKNKNDQDGGNKSTDP